MSLRASVPDTAVALAPKSAGVRVTFELKGYPFTALVNGTEDVSELVSVISVFRDLPFTVLVNGTEDVSELVTLMFSIFR